MNKYCANCGTELPPDVKFCSQCGKQQKQEVKVEQQNYDQTKEASYIPEKDNYSDKDRLISDLERAHIYFQQKQSSYDNFDKLTEEKKKLSKFTGWGLFIFGVVLTVIYFFLFIGPSEYIVETAHSVVVKFIIVSIGLIVIFPIALYNMSNRAFNKQTISINQQLNSIETNLRKHFNAFLNSPVSFKYSNPKIIDVLKDNISSGRADNAKDSISCMLDDLYKQQMLKKQDEISKNVKNAADSASAVALFSAGTFLNTRKK